MTLTEQELRDLAEAIQADPETEIEIITVGETGELFYSPMKRKHIIFRRLEKNKYRIKPQPKLRPMNQEEWREYTYGPFRGMIKDKCTTDLTSILAVGMESIFISMPKKSYWKDFNFVHEQFTKPDGSSLQATDE